MESNVPVISKRVWSMVCVAFFMTKKGISKGKLRMNLNMILKRQSKLAGKAIANLLSHHHHHGGSTSGRHSQDSHRQFTSSREYEYNCSNTPDHFFSGKRHRNHNHSHNHKHNNFFTDANAPSTPNDEVTTMSAMKIVLEMLNNDKKIVEASHSQSGFGNSPMRVTESPFPLRDEDEKDNQIDKAAEDFIKRFYSQLRKQD